MSRRLYKCLDVLLDAVRVEKFSSDVDDRLAAPTHDQSLRSRHDRRRICLEIFRVRQLYKRLDIISIDHHRHALLALADRKLRPVKPVVFFPNRVKIDVKPVGKLADRHAHAARSEIIAPLDQARRRRIAKQPLYFSFGRRIAFLNLRARRRQ